MYFKLVKNIVDRKYKSKIEYIVAEGLSKSFEMLQARMNNAYVLWLSHSERHLCTVALNCHRIIFYFYLRKFFGQSFVILTCAMHNMHPTTIGVQTLPNSPIGVNFSSQTNYN